MTPEEVLFIHFKVVKDYGGLDGVRNEQRLLSAVNKLNNPVGLILDNAAYFIRDVIQDHPFTDGNKRTAITVAAIYIARHGYILNCSPKELEDFAVEVATSNIKPAQIAQWLAKNTFKSNLA